MKPFHLLTTLPLLSLSFLLFSCSNGSEEYDATGSFEATEIIVSSQANGRILALNVNEGEQLQKEQIVSGTLKCLCVPAVFYCDGADEHLH